MRILSGGATPLAQWSRVCVAYIYSLIPPETAWIHCAFLDSYSISLHDKAATYARMLRDLPPGLNEWAIHPAHGTEQWQAIEPAGWQIRQGDHAFLTSPQAREIVDQEDITVIDYRPVQRAWNACTDPSPSRSR